MTSNSLPLSFRATEVDRILSTLQAGDSYSLVGIGSVGKSNLLRFLQQEDVRRAKLGQEWGKYLFVYVDVNKMLQQSDWGLFELMLHQILVGISQQDIDILMYEAIDDLHERSAEPATQHLALRYLDRALSLVCNRLDFRVVFLIDEFDRLCSALPAQTFAALRSLRDDRKYRLMYVVAARKDLSRLREGGVDIEDFEELVTPNTIWLVSYSEEDARHMLHRLATRNKVKLGEESIRDVLVKTGGHPGLIRAAFPIMCEGPTNLTERLLTDKRVQDECQRVWHSLAEDEQMALANLVSGGEHNVTPPEMMERLRVKGLVGGSWAKPNKIFSTLLADYIVSENPAVGAHIYIDRKKHIVFVDDRAIEDLAPLEYKLIEYLDGRRGQVITRDEIAQHLYPSDMKADGKGVADERIDAVLKRLRKAVEPEADEPRFILTMRGHGLKLEDGMPPKKKEITE